MNQGALKAIVCLLSLFLLKAGGQTLSDLFQSGASLQGAVLPIYSSKTMKLTAIVRVDRTSTEYERRGFFRIGMWPIAVLDGVTYEATNSTSPADALANLHHWLGPSTSKRVELRRVKLIFSPSIRLEAGAARCEADGHWELLNGVHFVSGAQDLRAAQGALQLAGPLAGQVVLETLPRSTNTVMASDLALTDSVHSPSIPRASIK